MATNYYKAIHHHHSLRRRHLISGPPPSSSTSTTTTTTTTNTTLYSRKLTTTTTTTSKTLHSSPSAAATSSTTSEGVVVVTFEVLEEHLSSQNFRKADEETRRLLIVLAGEPAKKRGYVYFSEVQFISGEDLKTIDHLWRKYSGETFGYSVQRKIWKKVNEDFTKFFISVGWMKKLDTEVEQYNYRAFPTEFMWELNDETPQAHLPLTNALRGTQLLNCIFNHPAFDEDEDDDDNEDDDNDKSNSKPLSKRVFKTDYSF